MRALRVLLACVVLGLLPAPSAAARVWTDVAAFVVRAPAPRVSDTRPDTRIESRRIVAQKTARVDLHAVFARPLPVATPPNTARTVVPDRYIYLRNRALLC